MNWRIHHMHHAGARGIGASSWGYQCRCQCLGRLLSIYKEYTSSSGASSSKCGYFEKKIEKFIILKLFLKKLIILKKIPIMLSTIDLHWKNKTNFFKISNFSKYPEIMKFLNILENTLKKAYIFLDFLKCLVEPMQFDHIFWKIHKHVCIFITLLKENQKMHVFLLYLSKKLIEPLNFFKHAVKIYEK